MKPIHTLTSTIKGMKVSHTVSPLTAFVGPNKSRKTAMLETVNAAITGKTSLGKTSAALASICGESENFIAEIQAENYAAGLYAEWGTSTWIKHVCSGEADKLAPSQLLAAVPAVSMRELLTFGSTRAREALFSRWGSGPQDLAPPADIESDADMTRLWEGLATKTSGTVAARLAAIAKAARSDVLAIGKTTKVLQSQFDAATKDILVIGEVTHTNETLDEALRKVETYKQQQKLQKQIVDVSAQLATVQKKILETTAKPDKLTELDEAERIKTVARDKLLKLTAALNQLKQEQSSTTQRLQRARALATSGALLREHNVHTCPLCKHDAEPAAMEQNAKELCQSVESSAKQAVAEIAAAEQKCEEAQREVAKAESAHAMLLREISQSTSVNATEELRLKAELRGLQQLVSKDEITEPALTEGDIKLLRDQMQSLARLKATRLQYQTEIDKLNSSKAKYKHIGEVCASLLQDELKRVSTVVSACVNKYLAPVSKSAQLCVTDSDCTWELLDVNGAYRQMSLLSGAEQVVLGMAIMLAWTEGNPLKILCLDDEDLAVFDEQNQATFLAHVAKLQQAGELTQVFAAATSDQSFGPEWTIINLQLPQS